MSILMNTNCFEFKHGLLEKEYGDEVMYAGWITLTTFEDVAILGRRESIRSRRSREDGNPVEIALDPRLRWDNE